MTTYFAYSRKGTAQEADVAKMVIGEVAANLVGPRHTGRRDHKKDKHPSHADVVFLLPDWRASTLIKLTSLAAVTYIINP